MQPNRRPASSTCSTFSCMPICTSSHSGMHARHSDKGAPGSQSSVTCEQGDVALHADGQHAGHVLGVAAPSLDLDLGVVVHAAHSRHSRGPGVSGRQGAVAMPGAAL